MIEAELVLEAKALLAEGPWWHAITQELYWVDIEGNAIHVFNPATKTDRRIAVGQMAGTVVGRAAGGVLLALQHGFYSLDLATETLTPIHDPEAHLSDNRFNDGKCDPAGRFWAGTTRIAHDQPDGALYCLNTDLSVQRKIDDVWISNGLAWSRDERTMYYIDSPTQQVVAFVYDKATSDISDRHVVIEIPEAMGTPDGCTIDEEGMLWIALWDGWKVTRWNPQTGKLLAEVKLPVARPTSCVFGGEKLDELFITTASTRMPAAELAKQPLAGGIFRCRPGVCGLPAHYFAG